MSDVPQSFEELFQFYQNQVKLYYSAVQAENELPVEVLFELNAALDHLSRFYVYGESQTAVCAKAFAHFKRACLDVFKIAVRDVLDKYAELRKVDISLIDNGEFDKALHALVAEIKMGAREARRLEGYASEQSQELVPAFERWLPVYEQCLEFEQDFYLRDSVDWARRKGRWISTKGLAVSILASVLLGALLQQGLNWLLGL